MEANVQIQGSWSCPKCKNLIPIQLLNHSLALPYAVFASAAPRAVNATSASQTLEPLHNANLGLVDPHAPQEPVLKPQQVQQNPVALPRKPADHGSGNGIEDKVVCSGDNGDENGERVENSDDDAGNTAQRGQAKTEEGPRRADDDGARVVRGERDHENR